MSSLATKTNNDKRHLEAKILLRLNNLPDKQTVYVLEAFAGDGVLWREVKKRTTKEIKILPIDKEEYKKVSLKGDNLKFLKGLDLSIYDVIDLDAYGSPSRQLDILKEKNYKGIVHCTFIQSVMGRLSNNILKAYGYSETMIKKCPLLFSKNGQEKMLYFIFSLFGTTKFFIYTSKKKNYFTFIIH